jgi:hypothetical protein
VQAMGVAQLMYCADDSPHLLHDSCTIRSESNDVSPESNIKLLQFVFKETISFFCWQATLNTNHANAQMLPVWQVNINAAVASVLS